MANQHLREPPPRCPDEREDVISTELWNGGDGTVLFNYLQQRETDTSENQNQALTTDPFGITD